MTSTYCRQMLRSRKSQCRSVTNGPSTTKRSDYRNNIWNSSSEYLLHVVRSVTDWASAGRGSGPALLHAEMVALHHQASSVVPKPPGLCGVSISAGVARRQLHVERSCDWQGAWECTGKCATSFSFSNIIFLSDHISWLDKNTCKHYVNLINRQRYCPLQMQINDRR